MNDLHLALRRLRRSPRFAAAAALTLAVGVGGVAGIFALVDSVILQPLPYPEPERLVVVRHTAPGLGLPEAGHSVGTYQHYRANSHALQDFAVYNENVVDLTDGGDPERVHIAMVTPNLFSTLGVVPLLGRPFGPADQAPGAPVAVILGYDLWARRYGADPGIIGRLVELNRAPRLVVGVLPRGFGFPRPETAVWYVMDVDPGWDQDPRWALLSDLFLSGVARLAPDASAESAERELNRLIPRLSEAFPGVTPSLLAEARLAALVEPLHQAMLGGISSVLWLILAAMGLVLAISAANGANLFLVRAEERRVEITVRAALGAGRAERLLSFVLEGVLLGAIGGALAVPLATALVQGVVAFGPADLPRLHEVAFQPRHLLLTLGVSIIFGAATGAVPLLRRRATEGAAGLRVDPRAAIGRAQRRAMQLFTVSEIALGFTLLAGAALLLQSFWRLRSVDPGFDPENLLTMEIALPHTPYPTAEAEVRFWRQLVERVGALPGVEAAGAATSLPLTPDSYLAPFLGEPLSVASAPLQGDASPSVTFLDVTPGYFETLRIPVLAGEPPRSWSSTRHTVVVNAAFARRFLSGQNPLDAQVRPVRREEVPWHAVTAVMGDLRADGLASEPAPVVYAPVSESLAEPDFWPSHMSLAVRTSVPPLSLAAAVRAVVREIDPQLPIAQVRTMEDIVAQAAAPARFVMLALTLAASVALFLSAVGTYGLVAYAVSRRTREIGVRIALGASGTRVRRMVLRQGAVLALVGVGLGVGVTLAVGRVLQGLLYQVRASDPATLVAGSLFLFAVVLLAVDLPARRAARVDPIVVLRYE